MTYVLPILSVLLVVPMVDLWRKDRSLATRLFVLSMGSGGLALGLWLHDDGVRFDVLVGSPGWAYLISTICAPLSCTASATFCVVVRQEWSGGRWVLVGGIGALLVAHTLYWQQVRIDTGPHLYQVLYDSYDVRPTSVLGLNLTLSISLLVASLYGWMENWRDRTFARQPIERLFLYSALAIFGGAGLYSVLMLAQMSAAWGGWGASGLLLLRVPLIVIVTAGALLAVTSSTEPHRLRRAWHALRGDDEVSTMAQLRQDIVDANILLSDRLVHLADWAAPEAVNAVAERCREREWPPHQCRVALEAARWITFSLEHAAQGSGGNNTAHEQSAAPATQLAAELAERARQEMFFYADVFRVATFALGAAETPLADEPDWRRKIGAELHDVLRQHGVALKGVLPHGLHTPASAAKP